MRLMLLLLLAIFTFQPAKSQEKPVLFRDAIKDNIKKYNKQSDAVYENGDIQKGQELFDSLVQNHLVGSKFDDYSFKSVNSRKVKLSKINRPVFIITYASWCIINKGEISALNKLARKYDDEMQFIVVFWDQKSNMKKIARQFNGKIKVCYANESYKNDASVVATLKHTLGFPTSYFLNSDLEVVDIKRGGIAIPPKTPVKKAIEMNYTVFDERITNFLSIKDEIPVRQVLASED
ncbi:TlpA family protein disulfide reductase [Flavobacterium silvaticum]|uniref:Redoxin domain-containing protein n=1 Tax=Flavobacterium silvaticum TaxID=1852020 RepID=A0A972JID6_9FLAO|nr:redoxin domain-containing protein [Flavobacterium silvaticum]NMH28108.1 redoxin domain-containing protein [Flavobacterium silvaticum]